MMKRKKINFIRSKMELKFANTNSEIAPRKNLNRRTKVYGIVIHEKR